MRNLIPKFALKQFSTYVAVIVIFVNNNVLDKNLECACTKEGQVLHCSLYMALPALILFVLQLWIDKTAQKIWRYLCTCRCTCRSCCCKCECCTGFFRFVLVLVYHTLKAVFIGLLWVVSLLIDGDWYVCCNNQSEHTQLACKDKHGIRFDEQEVLAALKNTSRVYGFSLLLSIICAAALMSLWGRKCCKDTQCNRRAVFDKLILKEEKNVLKEILGKAAKEKLTQEVNRRIRGQQWESCFDAAAYLIENPAPPIISETEENEERRSLLRVQETRPEESEDPEAGPSTHVRSEVRPEQEREAAGEENVELSTKV
ncbi:calcium homeostasis modulator protein 6-like isoform X1 [Channa argus]|uniref:calcium homeostasis modulator protein 6-like isoform X1 n=1 Tax=Channa argus TaxID=215402 RepID=UPI0035201F47